MRFEIVIKAFGFEFEKEWGNPDAQRKLGDGVSSFLDGNVTINYYIYY